MKKICLFWAGMCLVAAIITACGGYGSKTEETAGTTTPTTAAPASPPATGTAEATSPTATPGAAKITIHNFGFGEPITVPPGAQVSVTNNDPAKHSVTSKTAGQFDVDVDGKRQATFTAPTQPGEYPLYCKYHPSMKGTLIVQ
jgi:plastocyanin